MATDHWHGCLSRVPVVVQNVLNVSEGIMREVNWWLQVDKSFSEPVVCPDPNMQVITDACTTDWRAQVGQTAFKGIWPQEDTLLHFNVLEMTAVTLAEPSAHQCFRGEGCQTCTGKYTTKALSTHLSFLRQHFSSGIHELARREHHTEGSAYCHMLQSDSIHVVK